MGKADIGSKHILAGDPEEWIGWLLPDAAVQVEENLSGEFQFVLRHSDELFRVRGKQGPFLLLVEVQLHVDSRMPRRMRAYTALAEEKYDLPIYPVVFYLLPPKGDTDLPAFYHSEFMGLTTYQDFRVIPVWEMEAQRVLEEGIIGLVPFTPLMKGSDDTVIREGVNLLRNRDVGEEAEVALALFASFVMDSQQVQKIVRWNMAVLRESPWYNQILQEGLHEGHLQGFQEGHEEGLQEGRRKGRQEGRQEGRQQGRQEGRREGRREGKLDGQREAVVHLLQARFSPTGSHLADIADRLTLVKDEKHLQDLLVKAMYVSDLEAFREHLNGKSEA